MNNLQLAQLSFIHAVVFAFLVCFRHKLAGIRIQMVGRLPLRVTRFDLSTPFANERLATVGPKFSRLIVCLRKQLESWLLCI
jgi:hypothetical protein